MFPSCLEPCFKGSNPTDGLCRVADSLSFSVYCSSQLQWLKWSIFIGVSIRRGNSVCRTYWQSREATYKASRHHPLRELGQVTFANLCLHFPPCLCALWILWGTQCRWKTKKSPLQSHGKSSFLPWLKSQLNPLDSTAITSYKKHRYGEITLSCLC